MNKKITLQRVLLGDKITLMHGAGGKAMRDLINGLFAEKFHLGMPAEDQARLSLDELMKHGDRLAFTTDSFVIDPLFFPGGDIGKLAVNGTVNDLVVGGAKALYLSCGFMIEEGFDLEDLHAIVASMREAADHAGVKIVTGDTKVLPRGQADKLFINTTGIGVIHSSMNVSVANIQVGDSVIVNSSIGDHGIAILAARGELGMETSLMSDCRSLHQVVDALTSTCPQTRGIRDATRGGVAAVLNEFSEASNVKIELNENAIPVRQEVQAVCELLGLDPLYIANEGLLVAFVPSEYVQDVLATWQQLPGGEFAREIGRVTDACNGGEVVVNTAFGSSRRLDMLMGEQLPRIC